MSGGRWVDDLLNAADAVIVEVFGLQGGDALRDGRELADQPAEAVVDVAADEGIRGRVLNRSTNGSPPSPITYALGNLAAG
jgi:hypothetical protein